MFFELTYHGAHGGKFLLHTDNVSAIGPAEGCTRIDLRDRLEPIYVRESYDVVRKAIYVHMGLVKIET
jgi:hypothetical protein